MKQKPIYVAITIKGQMDELWRKTQQPNLRECWDMRFSSITYLAKQNSTEAQKSLYQTKIGMGMRVEGWGERLGDHYGIDGSRSSSLHFGTDQKSSIIKEGRGDWQYMPHSDDSITFSTSYDYETNWGKFGAFIDHIMFRPLMRWATALSFDVLKRWIERKDSPHAQYIRFFTHWLIAGVFFFIWMYHGLVPKILQMHPAEVDMITQTLSLSSNESLLTIFMLGALEITFAFIWLFYRNKRQLCMIQLVLFPLLMIVAVVSDPSHLTHPLSPLTFNIALFTLSLIGLMVSRDVPTASNCIRTIDQEY